MRFARCVVVTFVQSLIPDILATIASTTFWVLPFSGLVPHDAVGSVMAGTAVGVGVGGSSGVIAILRLNLDVRAGRCAW